MKMNQWVDFDTGDEAQSETVFSVIAFITSYIFCGIGEMM